MWAVPVVVAVALAVVAWLVARPVRAARRESRRLEDLRDEETARLFRQWAVEANYLGRHREV